MTESWQMEETEFLSSWSVLNVIVFIPGVLESFQYLISVSWDFSIAALSLDPNFTLGFLELRYFISEYTRSITYLNQIHRVKRSIVIDWYFVQIKVRCPLTHWIPSYSDSVVKDVFLFVCLVFSSLSTSTCSSLPNALSSYGSPSSSSSWWIVSKVFDDATIDLNLLWM